MRVCTLVSGSLNTECDVSEMGKLTCKFTKNINSTQTDFSVYFHSDKGHEGIELFSTFDIKKQREGLLSLFYFITISCNV